MSIFRFLWFRKLVRRHTRPIPYKKASRWRDRISVAYMLLAWNALGFIGWEYYQGRGDPARYYGLKSEEEILQDEMLSPAQRFAIRAGVEKAKIFRSKDMKTVDFVLTDYKNPEIIVEEEDDEDNVA